uniref:RxLR effector candidate protein n=2 Tax=Hyaloperonospora arabidopsidis (strain Emoy2) TaxID=559515 RepID=M4C1N2_HYAAE
MRLYVSAGLVSGALLVSAALALDSGELDTVALGALNDQRQPAGRLLRGGTDEGMTRNEERTSPLTSTMESTLQAAHGALHKAFTDLRLQLPKIENGEVDEKAAKAFWSSPALPKWFESAKGLAEPSEFAAYHYLMIQLTPGDLATIIHHQATKPLITFRDAVPGLKNKPKILLRELEGAQFRWWKHNQYSLEHILTKFLGLGNLEVEHPILKKYTAYVRDVMKDVWSP